MAKFELVSFVTCPFVQRAVILLNEKDVSFDIKYIDLSNKPDWFLKISPRGKVPILKVGEDVLFESQAICEYLDEVAGDKKLMPDSPVDRARDRAWFAMASEDLFMPQYHVQYGTDSSKVEYNLKKLREKLTRLNEEMNGRDYLSGKGRDFGMADVAMAPFFFRCALFKKHGWLDLLKGYQNLEAWSGRMLERASIQKSVRDDFESETLSGLKKANTLLFQGALK